MTKQNEQDILENLAPNLKLLKKAYGLTYKKIGEVLGVTSQQAHKYITGESKIPISKLFLLLDMINTKHKTQYTMDDACNKKIKINLEVEVK